MSVKIKNRAEKQPTELCTGKSNKIDNGFATERQSIL